jgi:hypothetical protein
MRLKPEFLVKDGRKQFVVLTYEQYRQIAEKLEDAKDLLTLREAMRREAGAPTISHAQMKKQLGLGGKRRRVSR